MGFIVIKIRAFTQLILCLDCVQEHIKHSMPLYILSFESLQNSWQIYSVSCLMGFVVINLMGSLSTFYCLFCVQNQFKHSMPLYNLTFKSLQNFFRWILWPVWWIYIHQSQGLPFNFLTAWTVFRIILNTVFHFTFSSLNSCRILGRFILWPVWGICGHQSY